MNRVFYLFRHGETDWNLERRCQGHTDIPLNETGLFQAESLAKKLVDIPLEVVVSSDLMRAHVTGQKVSSFKNIPLLLDSRLREMSYGVIEGLVYEKAMEIHGHELWQRIASFKKENDHVKFPEGETRAAARKRIEEALASLVLESDYKIIGISTHGGAIRNFIHSLLPEDHPIIPIPNCVVYKVTYNHESNSFSSEGVPFLT